MSSQYMHGPEVWTETEYEIAYKGLRNRADAMGFPTVGHALDELQRRLDNESE